MIKKTGINAIVDDAIPMAVTIRREIHQNPELSGEERETSALVARSLKSFGLSPHLHLDKTAVTATLTNGKGKLVVLRADMDALPIQEENDIPYRSKKAGVMHACGHDMHTAILVGAAKVLTKMKDQFKGTILFLFQPSEEVEPGGAYELIKRKIFPSKADTVFGLHVNNDHPAGIIGIRPGFDYASILAFDVIVHGKGAHGGTPEQGIDPVVCAASMVMELQTLISRECPPFQPAVLTIGSLHAGTRRNIIPDEARFAGTIRTHSVELGERLTKRVTDVLNATSVAFRTQCDINFEKTYPPTYNDPEISERARLAFENVLGSDNVVMRPNPIMYAEDFAYYQELVPGLFIHLGVHPPKKKTSFGIHTSRFLPDESAIKTGILSHVAFTLDFLRK